MHRPGTNPSPLGTIRSVDGVSTAAAVVLTVAFAWSGVTKAARPRSWMAHLRVHRLPRPLRAVALVGVPWSELAVVALFSGAGARAAAIGAALLIVVFSVALLRLWVLMGRVPVDCGCFGDTTARDVRLLLLRNGALLAGAVVVASHPVRDAGGRFTAPALATWAVAAAAWVWWQWTVHLENARSTA